MQLHQEVLSQAGLCEDHQFQVSIQEGKNVPRADPLISAGVEALTPIVASTAGIRRPILVASGIVVGVGNRRGPSGKDGGEEGDGDGVELHFGL